MKSGEDDPSAREQRLGDVLAEFLQAAEEGRAPSADELIGRHPDLRREIEEFLADRELLKGFRSEIREAGRGNGVVSAAEAPAAAGTVFGGYEVIREIARGGMGIVYEARQRNLDRSIALKVIIAGRLTHAAERERFRLEALAAARLEHPGIVPIHDVGEADGLPYYTMKLIGGGSLAQRGKELRGDWGRIASLMAAVTRAVDFGHRSGVIHRDLKPANILLEDDGRPVVTDFGLAKVLDASLSLTATGAILGTPNYMAPEQARGDGGASQAPAIDVYGLGAILYELLAGKPPFAGSSSVAVLRRVCEEPPPPLARTAPEIPRDLQTICLKALEKEQALRYLSAGELAEDLERFLRGEPIRARRVRVIERSRRWARRRKWAIASATVAAVVVTALAAALLSRPAKEAGPSAAELKDLVQKREREAQLRLLTANHLREAYGASEDPKSKANALEKLEMALRDGAEGGLVGFEWGHLLLRLHPEAARFPPLDGGLKHLEFMPDGQRLIVAWADWVGLLAPGGSTPTNFEALSGDFKFAVSSQGSFLASLGRVEAPLKVVDARSGETILNSLSFGRHPRFVSVAFSPDERRLVTGHVSGQVYVWDLERKTMAFNFQPRQGSVRTLAFLPDGNNLIEAGDDGATIRDAADGQELRKIEGIRRPPECVFISSEGKLLVTADESLEVSYFSLEEGRLLGTLPLVGLPARRGLDLDRKRSLLAVCSSPETIAVWKLPEKDLVASLIVPRSPIAGLRYSPDGRWLLTWSSNGSAVIWDAATFKIRAGIEAHPQAVVAASLSPDGELLATAGEEGEVKLWRVPPEPWDPGDRDHWGAPHQGVLGARGMTVRAGISRDAGLLITQTKSQIYEAWDLVAWRKGGGMRKIGRLPVEGSGFLISAVAPDASSIAGLGAGGRVRILALRRGTGPELPDLVAAGEGPWPGKSENGQFIFSPRVDRLFVVAGDGLVGIWRQEPGSAADAWTWERALVLPWDSINDAAVSSDLALLAVARRRESRVYLWDLQTGREAAVLEGHREWVVALSFSPDGRTLATGGLDHGVRLWRVEGAPGSWTLSERAVARGHTDTVSSIIYSPDGKTLASWGDDGHLFFWDPVLGLERGRMRLTPGNKQYACFSADGTTLVLCGEESPHRRAQVDILRAPTAEEAAVRWRESPELAGIFGRISAAAAIPGNSKSAAGSSDCAVRNFQASYDAVSNRVRFRWNPAPGDSGFRVLEGIRRVGADLPGTAFRHEDEAPPAAGMEVWYTLVSLGPRGEIDAECRSPPLRTFAGPADLVCCLHQAAAEVELNWTAPRNLAPDFYRVRRDGEALSLATGALSFTDRAVPLGEHWYEVLTVLGGSEVPPSIRCWTNVTGVAAAGPGGCDAVVIQYDFEGNLRPTTGRRDLEPMTSTPLRPEKDPPRFSFEERTIGGRTARVCRYSRGTGFRLFTGMGPSGGGRRVNQYSLLMDWMFEPGAFEASPWSSFYSADPSNLTDSAWQLRANGSMICGPGISGGELKENTWYRLAITVDVEGGQVAVFVNGARVPGVSRCIRDQEFSLGTIEDREAGSLLLFSDESGDTTAGVVNSVQLRDVALTEEEVAAFGGPTAEGIPANPPCPHSFRAALEADRRSVSLSWRPGGPSPVKELVAIRDGAEVARLPGDAATFTDREVSPGAHAYEVRLEPPDCGCPGFRSRLVIEVPPR